MWRGWTASVADGDAYERFFRERVIPDLQGVEGFLGATLLRRRVGEGVELVVLTRFESLDAVRRFAGADIETPVIEPEARALLSHFEERAAHYETVVDERG